MGTLTRPDPGRSERDELERLQQTLRDARRQREGLPRENAGLTSQVEGLEQELQELRRRVKEAREEAGRAPPSLPEQFVTPFLALPARRTAYGGVLTALLALLALVPELALSLPKVVSSLDSLPALALLLLLGVGLPLLITGLEDGEEEPAWRFDDEGFTLIGPEAQGGKVRYQEIVKVEVTDGWLQRLFGLGSLRITWAPSAPTGLGEPAGYPNRVIEIGALDDPKRLAGWLEARTRQAREEQKGAARAS